MGKRKIKKDINFYKENNVEKFCLTCLEFKSVFEFRYTTYNTGTISFDRTEICNYCLLNADRACNICFKIKSISEFEFRKDHNCYRLECKECNSLANKQYYQKNKEIIKQRNLDIINSDPILSKEKQKLLNRRKELAEIKKSCSTDEEYKKKLKSLDYQNNKEEYKQRATNYKKNNRDKYNKNFTKRIKEEPKFRLRDYCSRIIRQALNKKCMSKKGKSSFDILPYTLQNFFNHLESQFEPWMTWENWGKYDPKTWNDNDSSTWTWQIDHIIPVSDFEFSSPTDPEFQKCWALENLRPYSAKQNIIDGANRTRHKKLLKENK